MANTRDILTNESGDIQFVDGDIKWGDGTYQHQRKLMQAMKGSHKHAPARGVGIVNFINDENSEDLIKAIRDEFRVDGMTVNGIELEAGKLRVDANY